MAKAEIIHKYDKNKKESLYREDIDILCDGGVLTKIR